MNLLPPTILALAAVCCTACDGSGQPGASPATTPALSPHAAGANAAATSSLQPATGQPTFASPDDAVRSLDSAAKSKDLAAMARIAGLPEADVVTGDPDQDTTQAERFATAYDQRVNIVRDGDARARVFIGNDNYPLASPLVRQGDRWFFDSAGGKAELTQRVIGENELATIGVCRAYVQAQYEYYAQDRNADDVLEYAQHLASTRGQHDGLYWHTGENEPDSPLGPLVAQARAEGFLHGSARSLEQSKPYHGYIFKILTAQGPDAPGGRYGYIINGHMVAGFALVASPAHWNHTGVVTFIVGANGKVYQKNLGEHTAELAAAMTEFNPDSSWTLLRDE